jgi:hypothetical protein
LAVFLNILEKNYILAVHLAEINTDPDQQALDGNPDPVK